MKILIVTGSSGGHIFPALGLIESLKALPGLDALLVLPKRSSIKTEGVAVRYLATTPIALRINIRNIISVFNLLKGSLQSLFLLLEYRPDVVVGFGTIDSVPMVILAWLSRVKTLIHEQNVIPGRATRFLALFSDRIAVSFPKTLDYLKASSDKIAITGNPLRSSIKAVNRKEALDFFGFDETGFTILVVGGSQASHGLNMIFSNSVAGLGLSLKLQVIHICGVKDYSFMEESYRKFSGKVKLFRFLDEMHYAYSASELVIGRAGATSIAEIIYFAKPSILIPYPYAYRHQSENAKLLSQARCAVIIEEEAGAEERLREQLLTLISAPEKLKTMRFNFEGFTKGNAGENLAREAVGLGKN